MTSEEQSGENQSTPRSYDCTFCKRGFTNAQALGGHMNIHRKEKAKLKQSTSVSSSLSSSNNMIPTTATLPWVFASTPAEGHGRSEDEEINTTLTSEETLIIGEVRQQLPLFDEKRPSNMDQKLEIHHVLLPSEVASDQKIGSSSRHDSIVPELDLELRLGPDPTNYSTPPSSTSTGSTTHFF